MPWPVNMIRPATPEDLSALFELEETSFSHDRISRRNFRHILNGANATTFVASDRQGLCGYVTVLFRRGTGLGRIYSLAVARRCRGRGLGRKLLAAAEAACRERDCRALRLEVHPRNARARRLYRQAGYGVFGRYEKYYENGADAVRMEKPLPPRRPPRRASRRRS
ncbi:GNAT family N-acetyltransferase [Pelagibius marinus]|uniref:GNAT family N-acetyltransferase n=1 Tax=Pelagibius marinus TaxID=2762760 RepID=UPI001872995D|nr:N-acetyltransferase [Pelagibius marinus]